MAPARLLAFVTSQQGSATQAQELAYLLQPQMILLAPRQVRLINLTFQILTTLQTSKIVQNTAAKRECVLLVPYAQHLVATPNRKPPPPPPNLTYFLFS